MDETSPLATPRFLGIDEFAHRKGHRYDAILCDLDARWVIEISDGQKLEYVQKLSGRLNNPDKIEAVSMDMSASFRPAVQFCLPKAKIVVDHFHVIQHVSDSPIGRLFPVGHTKRKAKRSYKENSLFF